MSCFVRTDSTRNKGQSKIKLTLFAVKQKAYSTGRGEVMKDCRSSKRSAPESIVADVVRMCLTFHCVL